MDVGKSRNFAGMIVLEPYDQYRPSAKIKSKN